MPAESIELLIEFTKDEDARTRATAIAGLAKVADPRGFAPVVVALFDPVDEVRITAATALGVFNDDRAFEPLVECLKDPCEQVGVNCAWALGQIRTSRCAQKLIDTLASEAAPASIRIACATALGERAALANSDLLADVQLLDAARQALLRTAIDNDCELRATSIWSLGHLPHDPATVMILADALNDPYEWSVRYAIEALANAGDASVVPALQKIQAASEDAISDLASQAIERLA